MAVVVVDCVLCYGLKSSVHSVSSPLSCTLARRRRRRRCSSPLDDPASSTHSTTSTQHSILEQHSINSRVVVCHSSLSLAPTTRRTGRHYLSIHHGDDEHSINDHHYTMLRIQAHLIRRGGQQGPEEKGGHRQSCLSIQSRLTCRLSLHHYARLHLTALYLPVIHSVWLHSKEH